MRSTTIVLDGLPVGIRYEIHEDAQPSDQVEWHLDKDSEEMADQDLMLLEHLLRKFENEWITMQLLDDHQAFVYETDARAAATAEDIRF